MCNASFNFNLNGVEAESIISKQFSVVSALQVSLRKYKKLKIKIRKAELDLTFLTNCQTLNVYAKFLTFNLPSVTSHDARFIRKGLLRSAIKKRKKRVTFT